MPTPRLPPTATTFQWADDVYTFDLKLGQIRELEEKCKASVFVVLGRLFRQEPFVDDIRETIRLGLIGGGMPASKAWVLVSRYVEGQPLAENLPHAMRIMGALAYGAPQEDMRDDEEANPPMAATVTDASTSPPSMAAAPPSASVPDKSTSSQSGNGSPSSKDGTPRKAANPRPSRHPSPSITTVSQG